MLSGCNSKLRAHDIFYHKQKAEKVHWKWPTSLSKFASSDTLPPAKTNFKSLPKQYHHEGTKYSNAKSIGDSSSNITLQMLKIIR